MKKTIVSILMLIALSLTLIVSVGCPEPGNKGLALIVDATFVPGTGVEYNPPSDETKDYTMDDIDYIYFYGYKKTGASTYADKSVIGRVSVTDDDRDAGGKQFIIYGFDDAEYQYSINAKMKVGSDVDYDNDELVCNKLWSSTLLDMSGGSQSVVITLDGPYGALTVIPSS
jgi:hypothetical protein